MAGGQILELMPKVAADIKAIGKRRNTQQKYEFRSIEDLIPVVKSALLAHGVALEPQYSDREVMPYTTASGKVQVYVSLKLRLRYLAPDGSYLDVITYGDGADSGDKATNKAMTAALKYAHSYALSIPSKERRDSEVGRRQSEGGPSRLAISLAERAKASECLGDIERLEQELKLVKSPRDVAWVEKHLERARKALDTVGDLPDWSGGE